MTQECWTTAHNVGWTTAHNVGWSTAHNVGWSDLSKWAGGIFLKVLGLPYFSRPVTPKITAGPDM
jgi:hypothetical protein